MYFKLENHQQIFEHIDEEEYEKRQDARRNDDFIVDDDGFGYADKGGEIWEYEDDDEDQQRGKKKKRGETNVSVRMDLSAFFRREKWTNSWHLPVLSQGRSCLSFRNRRMTTQLYQQRNRRTPSTT